MTRICHTPKRESSQIAREHNEPVAALIKRSKTTGAEDLLAMHLRSTGHAFAREYRFAAEATGGTGKGCRQRLVSAGLKDWRFDFAIPDRKFAVECEGGAWTGGRHTTGTGFHADLLKYEAAQRIGWTVYRCDPAMIKSGRALQTIEMLLGPLKIAPDMFGSAQA